MSVSKLDAVGWDWTVQLSLPDGSGIYSFRDTSRLALAAFIGARSPLSGRRISINVFYLQPNLSLQQLLLLEISLPLECSSYCSPQRRKRGGRYRVRIGQSEPKQQLLTSRHQKSERFLLCKSETVAACFSSRRPKIITMHVVKTLENRWSNFLAGSGAPTGGYPRLCPTDLSRAELARPTDRA
ncbi:hypothetical protein N658DRAFT_95580 [Parathielavia hyrcaniae]|uniref:Uncharacterized protein n=1 Tax=Parathielavia hyrcaniae TaxID=113614 RepID=A0AAN6T1B8_9PEZI|nr:hypothetical protein N658DRAFT_95580 [Parathielavia hyrcaniae]